MSLNKSITMFIFSALIISLFSALVAADIQVNTYTPSKDFSIGSVSGSINMCACSSTYDTITITNTGTWPAVFSVKTDNKQATVSESSFELNPGATKQVSLAINADCNKGSDDIEITVTSNLGVEKTVTKRLAKDRCQNIEMWSESYVKDVSPCESRDITLYVKNVGPFREDYVLSNNYPDYISFNSEKFTLEPNQAAKITATADFDCEIYGIKDIEFMARAVNNRLTATLSAELMIAQDYDYELKVNSKNNLTTNVDVCNRVLETNIPLTIKNTGAVENTYDFEIKGLPSWIKHDIQSVTLKPGQEAKFSFSINSTRYRYEHKDYDITITVEPRLGDIVKVQEVSLNFLPCYEHQVKIYDGDNSERYPLKTCSEYLYEYDVEIINNGRYKETYDLSLEGAPSGFSLSKGKITVEPGKRDSVKLIMLGPEYNTVYDVKVNAKIFNEITESDDIWVKSYDKQSCHAVSVLDDYERVHYQTSTISIPVKNTGIASGQYLIYWNGSRILDSDDTLIELNVSQAQDITLDVNTAGMNESLYSGSIIVENLESDAVYSKEVTIKLKDKSFFTKAFEYFAFGNVCRQTSLYETGAILIVIILIILFLIFGPKYQYSFWNRMKSKVPVIILLIVIFLVALILVITTAGLPKTQEQVYNFTTNVSELKFEWLQNDKYVLDIGGFFSDPDNNTLKYNVTGLEHITAIVSGKVITFYPDLGWSGAETARIIAYDDQGGSVKSPALTLIVQNVPRKSFVELYNIYCWYANLLIFLALLVLVFIAVFVKQKRRTRK